MFKSLTISCLFGILAACGSPEGPVLDRELQPFGKADAGDVVIVRSGGAYDRVLLYGDSAKDLWQVMEDAAGFDAVRQGGLDYLVGYYSLCASNGSAAACAIYSRDVATTSGFDATIHGRRFASAASEIFGAVARAAGDAPSSVSQTSSALISCGKGSVDVWCGFEVSSPNNTVSLTTSFKGLGELGPNYVYEGWLITSNGPVSGGRFSDPNGNTLIVDADVAADSSLYVLTIEPKFNDDPAPAATHVVAGAFQGGSAALSTDHGAALGTDFLAAQGTFILETPSSAAQDDYDQGVWFLNPSAGPGASLALPKLPQGWAYEGWVVVDGKPISTGRFLEATGADSDAGGASAGPLGTPPFPGQDFINPALSLIGGKVVISVEPQPDDSAAPFALKPLVGDVTNAGPGASQALNNNAAQSAIVGTATLN